MAIAVLPSSAQLTYRPVPFYFGNLLELQWNQKLGVGMCSKLSNLLKA